MAIDGLPLAKIFWTILVIEALLATAVASGALIAFTHRSGPTSPDGGLVGAWIVVLPFAILALIAVLFLAIPSPSFRLTCILVLLSPLYTPILGRPILFLREKAEDFLAERSRQGAFLFRDSAHRRLAAAIAKHDVAGVKELLPAAGDLNRAYREKVPYYTPLGDAVTLLSFACDKANNSGASAEIVRLLLDAGANPNFPHGLPLALAVTRSRAVTELLLRAGAEVNALDGYDQPIWWLSFGREESNLDIARLLLEQGADIKRRNRSGEGPVAHAAEAEMWSCVWFLVQQGAGWKGERVGYGDDTVHTRLSRAIAALKAENSPVPDEMRLAWETFHRAEPQ